MRLLCTRTSPYARVVRVAVRERGLAGRVEEVMVATRRPDSPVVGYNPTGKVPTLITGAGVVLSESRLICTYLDTLHGGKPVVPPHPSAPALALEGIITGFLDGIAVWARELYRPAGERSPGILAQERARAERCLDFFEGAAPRLSDACEFAMLSLAAAVGRAAFSLPELDWAHDRPRLSAWFETYAARPAMRETEPG